MLENCFTIFIHLKGKIATTIQPSYSAGATQSNNVFLKSGLSRNRTAKEVRKQLFFPPDWAIPNTIALPSPRLLQ